MGGRVDITLMCRMRCMRTSISKISDIRYDKVHRVARAMISLINGHVRLMHWMSSVGEILCKVSRLMAGVAKDGKGAFVATIICSPTDSTSISAAGVVDLLMSSSASIAERRRADVAVAETG